MHQALLTGSLCSAALLAFMLDLDAVSSSPASIFLMGFGAGAAMALGGVAAWGEMGDRTRTRHSDDVQPGNR
jgi:hypothetical protein